jgi:hypothetical protein
MAETDILNPTRGYWPDLNDNPNPSYGYTRKSANNSALAKARMGAPYTRETMSQGFAFEFNYVARPWSTILRLKHFYEQFKGGYFTYIDWDGGGRHHVGRFTSPVNGMETSNGKYTVQGLLFEEMAQARMVEYPADFANWSRTVNVLDDYLNPAVANFSTIANAWITQLNPVLVGPSATDPSAYEIYNATPTFGVTSDWAQIQYVGWGFQMQFRTGTGLGLIALFVDGVYLGWYIDLSTGLRVADGSGFLPALGPGMTFAGGVFTSVNMPLDSHRVQVMAQGVGSLGAGSAVAFPAVTVIV